MKMTRKEFLRASAAAAGTALIAGGTTGASTAKAADVTATRSQGQMTLIKGAKILSMDPKLGDIYGGDVLIDGMKIAEVGHNIDAPNADQVDATDMILMPGMCDGHRHLWESTAVDRRDFTLVTWHMMYAVAMKPEDVYDYCYLGGKMAIDSGVTRVIDEAHVNHTPEKMEASIRGAIASGVGGVNCPRLCGQVSYGPGDTVEYKKANDIRIGRGTDWHFELAEKLRDELFSDSEAPLQFGLAHLNSENGAVPLEQVHADIARAWALEPVMMMGVIFGEYMGNSELRTVPDLIKAGLIRENYIVGHGNGITNDELLMLRDVGAGVGSTPRAEVRMNKPSPIARCFKVGCPVAMGWDHMSYCNLDYFEHIRYAEDHMWANYGENKEIAKTMNARDLMHIATLGGAKAMGMDSKVGSITPGKLADLVLLRTDRLGFAHIDDLAERVETFAGISDIDSVWVQGKLEKKNGELVDFDKGMFERVNNHWVDTVRPDGKTIKFIGEDGKILTQEQIQSPYLMPMRPPPPTA